MNTTNSHGTPSASNWENKAAIVTGAGQGIGLAICQQLIARGVKVILNDSDHQLATRAASTLGPNCLPLPGDAADIPFTRHMVDTAIQTFGHLDIVVANAGLTLFGDFFSYPPDSFSRVMQLNLGGSFFLAQAAAVQMRKQATRPIHQQAHGGRIIFTSSVTGHQAHKNLAAYGMSKAALEMLARCLVLDLSPYGITVNTVAPGATMTERTAGEPSYEKTWSTLTPMGRPASVQDIANAVLFLVSPEAKHITGQTLIVDGGWTAISPGPE